MSKTKHVPVTTASNVIPFPVKPRQPEAVHRWPKSLFPAGQHPTDAEPAPRLAPKRSRTAAEEQKRALYRALVWEVSAMMQDPNCPLRGDRA